MLKISERISIADTEIRFEAIRAQGAGGQNVNKVSSAIHLRFDIQGSSLPDAVKEKLLEIRDRRISKEGIVVIKAQRFRTREKNREDSLERLKSLILKALETRKKRKPTRPSQNAKRKRIDKKTRHGKTKKLRGKVSYDE